MHNRVSMSLYSGPAGNKGAQKWCHRILCRPDWRADGLINWYPEQFWFCEEGAVGWIDTGDSTLGVKKVRTAWKGTYQRYRDKVATLLLPHHGSRRSFDCDVLDFLPRLKVCAASAGHRSRYKHPSSSVRLAAKIRRKAFLHVSQKPETALIEEVWTL